MEENTSLEKAYQNGGETLGIKVQTAQGPFAWIADIEVNKVAYFGALASLFIALLIMGKPMFEICGYGYEEAYALSDVAELTWMNTAGMILNGYALFSIIFPMLKFFEWKYRWFLPVAAIAAIDVAGALYLWSRLDVIVKNSAIGYLYDLLGIELTVTGAWWLFLLLSVAACICALVMLNDIRKNEI